MTHRTDRKPLLRCALLALGLALVIGGMQVHAGALVVLGALLMVLVAVDPPISL
jgi:hypothetical protein